VEAESLYKTNAVIKVKVPLFTVCQHWFKLHFFILITAHHDRSIPERVIAVAETLRCSHVYCKGMATEIPEGWASWKAQGLWRISSPAQDAASIAKAQRNPFFSARDLKAAAGFPEQEDMIILRLKAAGLRAWHAAVKELLTDEHKLYHFAFAESNVDCKCDRVIFTDESTFSSANDGLVLVYRPQGEHYNLQYISTCKRSGRVSVGAGSPMKGLEFSIV
jgi:hypothetical protein